MVCKANEEREGMRRAAVKVSAVLEEASRLVAPGVRTLDIDRAVEERIEREGAKPAFKGYRNYPNASCISVNDVVVHGIPSATHVLKDGDIVSIDVGLCYDGYFGDVAATFAVGELKPELRRLVDVTMRCLQKGIKKAQPGAKLGDISHAIQKYVERAGYGIVRDFVGHGIGRQLHDSPEVPNFGKPHRGPALEPGMVLAIEPMTTLGHYSLRVDSDGWTARTKDGEPSAHFEHMVMVGKDGPEQLTTHPLAEG